MRGLSSAVHEPSPTGTNLMVPPVKKAIRNETSLLLVIATVCSVAAIPAMSGFFEPSQPPSVAAVEVGMPRDAARPARNPDTRERQRGAHDERGARRSSRKRRAQRVREAPVAPERSVPAPAPSAPAPRDDDADDGGGDDAD